MNLPSSFIRCHEDDPVVVAVQDVPSGAPVIDNIFALEPILRGHKVAISAIRKGEYVTKYGQPIGRATEDIKPGSTFIRITLPLNRSKAITRILKLSNLPTKRRIQSRLTASFETLAGLLQGTMLEFCAASIVQVTLHRRLQNSFAVQMLWRLGRRSMV